MEIKDDNNNNSTGGRVRRKRIPVAKVTQLYESIISSYNRLWLNICNEQYRLIVGHLDDKSYSLGIITALNFLCNVTSSTKKDFRGRIDNCIHYMHIFCQVNLSNGELADSETKSANIDRIISIINTPITRDSILDRQKIGARLLALIQKFGWQIVSLDEFDPKRVQSLSSDGINRLLETAESRNSNLTKGLISQTISPDDVVNWVIHGATENGRNLNIVSTTIHEIKSVNFKVAC